MRVDVDAAGKDVKTAGVDETLGGGGRNRRTNLADALVLDRTSAPR
jgi:hypothetical protein